MAAKRTRRTEPKPQRFIVGEYVWGPFIFWDSGTVIAVGKPNRYGYRMVEIRSDDGGTFGILEVWPSATREEATRRYTERYGHPPAWREEGAESPIFAPMCARGEELIAAD